LAAVYLESGNTVAAAGQLQKIAADNKDPEFQRDAMWQSAELYEKGDALDKAAETYKAYVKKYPQPLSRATEARQKLIEIYGKLGQANTQRFWRTELVASIPAAGNAADDRGRLLAAQAAFELAEPTFTAFSQVQLKQPLKQTLQRKKQMMDEALKAYNQAADYRIAEITTASTYRIGQLYFDFSKAILDSERPKGMSEEALAQYELILEEQAIPLEEKAIEVHTANADRVSSGVYDEWVRKSFTDLAKLMPARYGKVEKYAVTFTEIN
jgi:tetratricopeptide (TPR) repeat protein